MDFDSQAERIRFQSTLPVAGERCVGGWLYKSVGTAGFNPRSPLPGSDAYRVFITL